MIHKNENPESGMKRALRLMNQRLKKGPFAKTKEEEKEVELEIEQEKKIN